MSVNVFGYAPVGKVFATIENTFYGSWWVAPYTANVVGLNAYLACTTTAHKAKAYIYAYTADNNAGNQLGVSNEVTVSVASGWVTFTLATPVAVTAGTKYFLCLWSEATTGDCQIAYDTNYSSTRGVAYTGTYSTIASPLTGESGIYADLSLYANYEGGPLTTRITQAAAETLSYVSPKIKVTQALAEVLSDPGLYIRVAKGNIYSVVMPPLVGTNVAKLLGYGIIAPFTGIEPTPGSILWTGQEGIGVSQGRDWYLTSETGLAIYAGHVPGKSLGFMFEPEAGSILVDGHLPGVIIPGSEVGGPQFFFG